MSGISDNRAHRWLLEIAENAWVSLHYESPAIGGIGLGEISGGGYVRKKAIFTSPANRTIWSLEDVKFTGLTQNRVTHFGIWDAQNLGELAAYGPLPQGGAVILNGQGYYLYAGKLAVSIA